MEDDDYAIDPDFLRKFTEQYADLEHPLFMDEIPHDTSTNEDLEALQQLLAQGETRDSIAEKYKEVGNGYVQQGAYFYEAAISSYTNGIEAQSKNEKLNAQLYSNRALVHLKRKEYVKCVDDCRKCIKRDPGNVKAYYRAASASYELELYKPALAFCVDYYEHKKKEKDAQEGDILATLTAASGDFAAIYKRTLDRLKERDAKIAAAMKKDVREKIELMDDAKSAIKLLSNHGIKLHKDIYEIPKAQNVVFRHDNGRLFTSCLVIYDELQLTDYIEQMDYATTMGDHLDVMFQDDSDEKAFTRHNSRCLYEMAKGKFYEFDTNTTMATVIAATKVAYKVAPVHIVHKEFDVNTLSY